MHASDVGWVAKHFHLALATALVKNKAWCVVFFGKLLGLDLMLCSYVGWVGKTHIQNKKTHINPSLTVLRPTWFLGHKESSSLFLPFLSLSSPAFFLGGRGKESFCT